MGNEQIRFGMSDYNGSKGFRIRNFNKLANEIRIDDIFNQLGGEKKMSEKTKNTMMSLFISIAGQDGVIDKNELKKYLMALDKAAADGDVFSVDKETLDRNELYDLEAKRGNVKPQEHILGIPVNIDKEARVTLGRFVKALVNANDKNVVKEAKEEAAKKAEAADLARRTSYDKQGNRIVKYDDKTVIYSGKSNHVMKEIVDDKDYVWTTKYLKDDRVTQKTTKRKDGSYSSVQNYYYNKNGTLTKTVEKDNNGVVDTRHYYKSGNVSKEIYNDPHINEVTENYYKDGAYNSYKEVVKDKAGNVEQTTMFKNTKEGNRISSETKNADGKTTHTANYDKNGDVKTETYYAETGHSSTFTLGKHGRIISGVYKDANGAVVETEQHFYDAKGRDAKFVRKDADGNITQTSTTTYGKNSSSRTETRDADGNLKEVFILNKNKKISERYNGNKLLCTEETTSDNKSIYKNAEGEVITEEEYMGIIRAHRER